MTNAGNRPDEVEAAVASEAQEYLERTGPGEPLLTVYHAIAMANIVHRLALFSNKDAFFLTEAKRTIQKAIDDGGETARRALLFSLSRRKWEGLDNGIAPQTLCGSAYARRMAALLADPESFNLLTITTD